MNTRNLLLLSSLTLLAACGGTSAPDGGADAGEDAGSPETTWECTTERADWEQCVDGKVAWCHIGVGDPHFHWGADCQALGQGCVEVSESKALCLDTASTCDAGASKCEGNTAYTCVEVSGQHRWAQEPCGTAALCEASATAATCVEKADPSECGGHGHLHDGGCECAAPFSAPADGGLTCVIDPHLVCDQFQATPHAVTAVPSFAQFSGAHIDVGAPALLTLPATGEGFAHFPVAADGTYVLFASHVGSATALMFRDGGVAMTLANGTPNGKCPNIITEHFHLADLVKDDATAEKVPFILRFKAADQLAGDAGVRLMVLRK